VESHDVARANVFAYVRSANFIQELIYVIEGDEVTSCDEDVHVVEKLTGRSDVEAMEVEVGEVKLWGLVVAPLSAT